MTYLLLNVVFLAVAVGVAAIAFGTRRLTRRSLPALGVTLVAVLALTAVFDNLMIAVGLFGYDPAHTTGLSIGLAPLEDFSYPLAAVLLLPSLWALFGGPDGVAHDDRAGTMTEVAR
ncbi:lycopene cyclase domain-containing protein [Leifsonia kafniensis]|uniref:Lycopene cyclase domain-containing protein n=1 Tax=Leifsonia kafniensis TaxID=475957 RepID=A0ABP7KNF0_9MICO